MPLEGAWLALQCATAVGEGVLLPYDGLGCVQGTEGPQQRSRRLARREWPATVRLAEQLHLGRGPVQGLRGPPLEDVVLEHHGHGGAARLPIRRGRRRRSGQEERGGKGLRACKMCCGGRRSAGLCRISGHAVRRAQLLQRLGARRLVGTGAMRGNLVLGGLCRRWLLHALVLLDAQTTKSLLQLPNLQVEGLQVAVVLLLGFRLRVAVVLVLHGLPNVLLLLLLVLPEVLVAHARKSRLQARDGLVEGRQVLGLRRVAGSGG
mmetsp:Transcript_7099/g.19202  ORF Transcript_7099/g.19202 Transcript_7099/m.19202 type:complete len:263 (-) Transcript_7099:581-1369(-)